MFGAVFIIGGIVGSAVFGIWVELKKTYKLSVIIISVLSVGSTIATAFAFTSGSSSLVTASCFVIGFSMIPIMAVGFELGVEVTFPIDESYSTGLLMFAGQFLGIIYVCFPNFLYNLLDRDQFHSDIKEWERRVCHKLDNIRGITFSVTGPLPVCQRRP